MLPGQNVQGENTTVGFAPEGGGGSTTVADARQVDPPDCAGARQFLSLLEPLSGSHCFHPIWDGSGEKPRPPLHGTLDEHLSSLVRRNQEGFGIFVAVNEVAKGERRRAENVTRVRALFADADDPERVPEIGALIERIGLPHPSMIVESSAGKRHYYWLTDDCPLAEFTAVQKALSKALGTDPVVHDLARVMRLPGFYHRKGRPFRTRLVYPV